MQTVLAIIKMAGGWHPGLNLKIDNPPHIPLVIEAMDESGPMGLPAICVCHYGEQNGDLMRDPEMCFELGLAGTPYLSAFYYRNDRTQTEEWSRYVYDGDYIHLFDVHMQHKRFARQWDSNLRLQGFAELSRGSRPHAPKPFPQRSGHRAARSLHNHHAVQPLERSFSS